MNKGLVVKIISNDYFIKEKDEVIVCKARGKLKNDNVTIQVGDTVIYDKETKYIKEVLKRKNNLERPNVANVDQAFLLTSLKKPAFDSNLLDKLICICEINKIEPVIIFSKKDLLNNDEKKEIKKIFKYYKSLGYKVLYNTYLFRIKRLFKNKTTVFTGQSGSGKSSLMNKLNKKLDFETNEISEALGRGKHTTRYVTLVSMYKGKVVDTPGFSSLDLKKYSILDIKEGFVEFKKVNCPYKDCNHINEKDCKVKTLVGKEILKSRYENYCNIIEKRDRK